MERKFNEYFLDFLSKIPATKGSAGLPFDNVIETISYLLKTYGECMYVKIYRGKIIRAIPLCNPVFSNKWQTNPKKIKKNFIGHVKMPGPDLKLDGHEISRLDPEDDRYLWIVDLVSKVCESHSQIPNRDLVFSLRYNPAIKKDGAFADASLFGTGIRDWDFPTETSVVHSFGIGNEFGDVAFPTYEDYDRIRSNRFGVLEARLQKWSGKQRFALAVIPTYRPDIVSLVKNLAVDVTVVPVPGAVASAINGDALELALPEGPWDQGWENSTELLRDYKFLICADDRFLSTLLFSGACVIRLVSPGKENWFSKKLISGTNCISCLPEDLESVVKNLDPEGESERAIAESGRLFAVENLSLVSVTDAVKDAILYGENYSVDDFGYEMLQAELQRNSLSLHISGIKGSKKQISIPREIAVRRKNNPAIQMAVVSNNVSEKFLFVKKYPNSIAGINDAFIGVRLVNQIAHEIPNFCWTHLGYPSREGWMVVRERLVGESLNSFLEKNPKMFPEIFSQICFALQVAYERIAFVHGQLSPENVIVVDYGKPIKIVYRLNSSQWAIETRFVAVIINYSNSSCIAPEFGSETEFNKIFPSNKKIFVGKMETDDLESLLHVDGSKDSKNLLKLVGKNLFKKILNPHKLEDAKTPEEVLKATLSKSQIKDSEIRLGKIPEAEWTDHSSVSGIRMELDKMEGSQTAAKDVAERVFSSPFPNGICGVLESAVLQYEITNTLTTALLDLDMKMSVNLTVAENIRKALMAVDKFYSEISRDAECDDWEERGIHPWSLKVFITKYFKAIANHPSSGELLRKMKNISLDFLEDLLTQIAISTKEFYESL